jgi:peptidoglycan/xylan/chitin deacetylase (PgdA/CDA1 family)
MISEASGWMFETACSIPGGIELVRRLRTRSIGIVMYHGVYAKPMPIPNWCQLDAAEFERQIEFLSREYRILPLQTVIERLGRKQPLPESTACLTFDDGFRNVWTTAFPILNRHQAPATVFLVTSVIGTRQPAWPDVVFHDIASTQLDAISFAGENLPLTTPLLRYRASQVLTGRLKAMENNERERQFADLRRLIGATQVHPDSPQAILDWDEIHQLARTGLIDFGSHTHTHPILSKCSEATQREELRVSRDILIDRLGKAELFAYPNGTKADFTEETKMLVREMGFRGAVSTIRGLNLPRADLFALRRVSVGLDTVGRRFQLGMAGL